MHFCYIDESGGFEAPNLGTAATPLVVIVGVAFPASAVPELSFDLLHIKRKFKVQQQRHHLDYLLQELKGSELRKGVRSKGNVTFVYATPTVSVCHRKANQPT